MKKSVAFFLSAIIALSCPFSAFAHSGRTDGAGGHHDYKNVSGLGYYHYHHGYPAHLHPNGVCPYESGSSSTTTSSSTQSTSNSSSDSVQTNNASVPKNSTSGSWEHDASEETWRYDARMA